MGSSLLVRGTLFVAISFAGQAAMAAQPAPVPGLPPAPGVAPPTASIEAPPAYTTRPREGDYRYYDYAPGASGLWQRPTILGRTKAERCAPDPFYPRGYGNLFAPSCTSYRLDYSPYVVKDPRSQHGPSYYMIWPDEHCDPLQECDCGRCWKCQSKTK